MDNNWRKEKRRGVVGVGNLYFEVEGKTDTVELYNAGFDMLTFEEKDSMYIYTFGLPGLTKKDLDVVLRRGNNSHHLEISSNITLLRKQKNKWRVARPIPLDSDLSQVIPRMKNGVLSVTIMREKNIKKIEVK